MFGKKVKKGVLSNVTLMDIEALNQGNSWEAVFKKDITVIGANAFCRQSRLQRLPRFPEGLEEISNWAFAYCPKLSTMRRFPESLKRIGDCAFRGSESLLHITIPKSVTSIGEHAFEDCSNLKYVVFSGRQSIDLEWLDEIGLGYMKIMKLGNDIIVGLEDELIKYSTQNLNDQRVVATLATAGATIDPSYIKIEPIDPVEPWDFDPSTIDLGNNQ